MSQGNPAIPLCTENQGLNRYRAIVSPGRELDIVPENYELKPFERDPLSSEIQAFIRKYGKRYGQINVCRNENAFYFQLNTSLNLAGQPDPYSVPFCQDSQYVRRVILYRSSENKDRSYIDTIHMSQPLADSERDVDESNRAFWGDYFSSEGEGVELCQLKVADSPVRHALFLAYNKNPDETKKCEPSKEVVDGILNQTNSINEQVKAIFEAGYSPSLMSQTSELVKDIEVRAGFLFTIDQREALTESVAFAINYQVSGSDLGSIADDLAQVSQDEGQFLYSLMTVVAIRVAKNLGPISLNFDEIAVSVENAIRSGLVTVKADNVVAQEGDYIRLSGSGMPATYSPEKNELVYQVVGGRPSIFSMLDKNTMMFDVIVHESVHVYQDIQGKELSFLDSDLKVDEIQGKTQRLLRNSVQSPYTDSAWPSLQMEDLEDYKILVTVNGLRCMGYSDEAIAFETEYWNVKNGLTDKWQREIEWELSGLGLGESRAIYTDLLRIKSAYNLMKSVVNSTRGDIERKYAEPHITAGERYAYAMDLMSFAKANLPYVREVYHMSEPQSPEGAVAALGYLSNLGQLIAGASYLSPKIPNDAADEFIGEFDVLSDALLYETLEWNGICPPLAS